MSTLKAHNIEPATGTDVALGAAGDSITVSGDSLKLDAFKDAGGNTLFSSNGSGTVSNVNAGLKPGGPILITTATASSSSYISFTSGITSTYDKYMFVFDSIVPSLNSTHLRMSGSTDGGSSYGLTKTSAAWYIIFSEGNSGSISTTGAADLSQDTAVQLLMYGIGSAAGECAAGVFTLYSPSNTTYVTHYSSACTVHREDDSVQQINTAGYFNLTTAINAIKFTPDQGTIASGTIKMYGIV